jgi:hypothetical protein
MLATVEAEPGYPEDFRRTNKHGFCSLCSREIIYRPYMPKQPPKVCIECFGRTLGEGE